jgi:aminopeptidase N
MELAEDRSATISDLRYALHFDLPDSLGIPVTGEVTIRFARARSRTPLVLDFRAPPDHILAVALNGDSVPWSAPADHIVIPAASLGQGEQVVTVRFRSSEAALNRQPDLLYALFVPDRASTAFPVFEQPNLKARFTLSLGVPAGWNTVSNGPQVSRDSTDPARHRVDFAETEPISTYLFTFAAGRFVEERAERNGRTLVMYHRETDSLKLARNRTAIFDLHATALDWLEEYTGIPYPFGKFAFFAVPAFQFGGMEHPGAVWYRAESLFLDPTATRNQELGRASLIAHETAHMWFGDLVTMRWFNDVWMKEVFANFMAAKIAGPSFPDLNLRLRFFQAHHPAAYAVDRTPGANPIRQELDNLREAGSLYGAIIYQKAPVMMAQLEALVGEETFREGLRRYLDRHRFGNAGWPDLVQALDELTEEDLSGWSRAWIEQSGRPRITARWADSGIVVSQSDPDAERGLRWIQPVVLALGRGAEVEEVRVELREERAFLPLENREAPAFILPGADGLGYGRFELDTGSLRLLRDPELQLVNPLYRSVAWQALWEELLDGRVPPADIAAAAVNALGREDDELVTSQVLGLLRAAWWRFLPDTTRRRLAPEVEAVLWRELERAPTAGRKGAYFSAILGLTLSPDGMARLERIWRRDETPRGLPLAEQQYIALAEGLAVRGVAGAEAILDAQESRITNPDRLGRFRFMRPALSQDPARRDSLFHQFAVTENRRRESWVLDALAAMHHPLRAEAALPQVRPALELVEEIQRTGDIFFPLRWMNALLDGHQSPAAAEAVRQFLADHPEFPARLRGKLLQAADDLFRAARIISGGSAAPAN